jgi:hypothetical protein
MLPAILWHADDVKQLHGQPPDSNEIKSFGVLV